MYLVIFMFHSSFLILTFSTTHLLV